MASLEQQKGWWRIVFRYEGEKFQRALNTEDAEEARALKVRLEENLKLLKRGRLAFHPGDDLVTILLSDGKLNANPKATKRVTLGDFFEQYRGTRPPGKESSTTYTENIHIEHLLRLLGTRTAVNDVPQKLQDYVRLRSVEKGRRGQVSHMTVKKELGTLSSIWNRWGLNAGLVPFPLTLKNLEYVKRKEKPPFQTWEQIERKIALGASTALWDSVYLTVPQVEELLADVKASGSVIRGHKKYFPFVYPMFVFCAHTGARRSEMVRSRREDFDFERGEITIREKKKDQSKEETYRHVPLTPILREAMVAWFLIHPGGAFTFCTKSDVPFTLQMANHHFRWALDGGRWRVIRGWHTFRHSYASNLAAGGVDQRIIDKLMGHQTEQMRRRYQHLHPSTVESAVTSVYGYPVSGTSPR